MRPADYGMSSIVRISGSQCRHIEKYNPNTLIFICPMLDQVDPPLTLALVSSRLLLITKLPTLLPRCPSATARLATDGKLCASEIYGVADNVNGTAARFVNSFFNRLNLFGLRGGYIALDLIFYWPRYSLQHNYLIPTKKNDITRRTHNVKCLLMTNSTMLRNLVTRKQPDSALNMPNAKHA
ncbi:hypothetical protein YC2023_118502 [Brassica napus]